MHSDDTSPPPRIPSPPTLQCPPLQVSWLLTCPCARNHKHTASRLTRAPRSLLVHPVADDLPGWAPC